MDRVHRQELKHDRFVEQVGHSVEYAAGHASEIKRYGLIALGLVLVIVGVMWYRNNSAVNRDAELSAALRIQEASVGPGSNEFVLNYPTQAAKDAAFAKAFNDLASKYSGLREGAIAEYYLGINAADKGNMKEAEKHLKAAADSGPKDYASQAKLSLAGIYASTGKSGEAEKLLRGLIDNPTILVSKEQATIALAKLLSTSKPAEARKILEPLRAERGAVSRAAISTLSEIPNR